MEVNVEGVYEEPAADDPCHLVEVEVREPPGALDPMSFTQEEPNQPRDDWQVPWDERYLDETGQKVIGNSFDRPDDSYWNGTVRLAFFMHLLDLEPPLITPLGEVQLPPSSAKPERLSEVVYEAP